VQTAKVTTKNFTAQKSMGARKPTFFVSHGTRRPGAGRVAQAYHCCGAAGVGLIGAADGRQ